MRLRRNIINYVYSRCWDFFIVSMFKCSHRSLGLAFLTSYVNDNKKYLLVNLRKTELFSHKTGQSVTELVGRGWKIVGKK